MSDNRISKIMGRISGAFSVPSRHDAEMAYLNRSTSMVDLERRQREVENGKFRGF